MIRYGLSGLGLLGMAGVKVWYRLSCRHVVFGMRESVS